MGYVTEDIEVDSYNPLCVSWNYTATHKRLGWKGRILTTFLFKHLLRGAVFHGVTTEGAQVDVVFERAQINRVDFIGVLERKPDIQTDGDTEEYGL